jgi:hypothetical protein
MGLMAAKYMSIVESKGVGQPNTSMCATMKQDKSINIVADTVYPYGLSASFADSPFIFDKGRL